jgi:hypothetical protein
LCYRFACDFETSFLVLFEVIVRGENSLNHCPDFWDHLIFRLVKIFDIFIVLINLNDSDDTSLAIELKIDFPFVKIIGISDDSSINKFDNGPVYPFEEFIKIPYAPKDIFDKISCSHSNLKEKQLLVIDDDTQVSKIIRFEQRVKPYGVLPIAIIAHDKAYMDIGEIKDISSTGISFHCHCRESILQIDDALDLVYILPNQPSTACSISVKVRHRNPTFVGALFSTFAGDSGQIIYDYVLGELNKNEPFAS